MITGDIVKRVRRQFGDDFKGRFGDSDVFRWINDCQREVAVDNKLLQKNVTQALTGGTPKYNIPADMLKLHSVTYNGSPMQGYQLKEFQDQFEDADAVHTGVPQSFTVWAGQLWFWPYPPPGDNTHSVVIFYTRFPVDVTTLSSAIDLPLMYHNRVVEYCMAQAMELDEDREGYALKMQEFKVGVQNTKDDSEFLTQDAYPGIQVSPDDWDYSHMAVYL